MKIRVKSRGEEREERIVSPCSSIIRARGGIGLGGKVGDKRMG